MENTPDTPSTQVKNKRRSDDGSAACFFKLELSIKV